MSSHEITIIRVYVVDCQGRVQAGPVLNCLPRACLVPRQNQNDVHSLSKYLFIICTELIEVSRRSPGMTGFQREFCVGGGGEEKMVAGSASTNA